MIIKPTNIGASTLTSNTKIDSIIPIIMSALVPKAQILLAVLN